MRARPQRNAAGDLGAAPGSGESSAQTSIAGDSSRMEGAPSARFSAPGVAPQDAIAGSGTLRFYRLENHNRAGQGFTNPTAPPGNKKQITVAAKPGFMLVNMEEAVVSPVAILGGNPPQHDELRKTSVQTPAFLVRESPFARP